MTQTDNNKEQICYCNRNKIDTTFNSFLVAGKKTSSTSEIIFSIDKVIDKTNRNNNIYFEINNELNEFKNDNVQYRRQVQQISEGDTVRRNKH